MLFVYITFSLVCFATAHKGLQRTIRSGGINVELYADFVASCLELINPEIMKERCCESMGTMDYYDLEGKGNIACKINKNREFTCDDAKCVLQSLGIWDSVKDDIDEEKAEKKMLEREYKDPKARPMMDMIRKHCLGGRYKVLPPANMCNAVKYSACSYLGHAMGCANWSDKAKCKKLPAYASSCRKLLGTIQNIKN